MDDDKIWLDKLTSGDPKAYHILFDKYYYASYSFSLKFLKEKADAEDVVQDVFCDLWLKKESYISVENFRSYLYTALRNRCLALIKHQKVKAKFIDNEKQKHEYDFFLENILEEEVYRKTKEAVQSLPRQMAKLYELVLSGNTNDEICKLTGLSMDAVKSLKKRGKVLLRQRLKHLLISAIFYFNYK